MIKEVHERAIAMARTVWPLVRSSRPLLFHGTRYGNKILKENMLEFPSIGNCSLHFSRQLPIAIYSALLDGRDNDEGVGAVLVFDRDRLVRDYRVECYNADRRRQESEADELIYGRDVVRLDRYLTHTVWFDESGRFVGATPHSPLRHDTAKKPRQDSHGRRGRQLTVERRQKEAREQLRLKFLQLPPATLETYKHLFDLQELLGE